MARTRANFGIELSYDTSLGDSTYQPFSGTLTQPGAILIFDNQSDVTVTISQDGTNDAKTLISGEVMILDLRTNRFVPSDDLAIAQGTQFYAKSSAGTGNFYISYIYQQKS